MRIKTNIDKEVELEPILKLKDVRKINIHNFLVGGRRDE